jgi:hypothetical protein
MDTVILAIFASGISVFDDRAAKLFILYMGLFGVISLLVITFVVVKIVLDRRIHKSYIRAAESGEGEHA